MGMGAPTPQDIEGAIWLVKVIFGLILAAAIVVSIGIGMLIMWWIS